MNTENKQSMLWIGYYISLALALIGALVVVYLLFKLFAFNFTESLEKTQWSGLGLIPIVLISAPVVLVAAAHFKVSEKLKSQGITAEQTKQLRISYLSLNGLAVIGITLVTATYVVYMVRVYL